MAKIPETLGPRAIPTPQRRVWSVDNGATIRAAEASANQTAQAGEDLTGMATKVQQEANARAGKDAALDAVRRENEAQQSINGVLYGDGDNEGIYAKRGAYALNAPQDYAEKIKPIKEKMFDGVTDPAMRAMLEKSWMQNETGNLAALQRHAQQERQSYSTSLLKERADLAREKVALAPTDPLAIEESVKQVRESAAASAKIQGFMPGDDAYNGLVRGQVSAVYATQLDTMLNSQDATMQAQGVALFDKYRTDGDIDYATVRKLDGIVDQTRPRVQASAAFSEMVNKKATLKRPEYGLRADGTKKGSGYLGEIKTADGRVMTELSIGVEIDGKETEIPSIVPTLTKKEIDYLAQGNKPTDAIVKKATEHAIDRMGKGKSPFADEPATDTSDASIGFVMNNLEGAGAVPDGGGISKFGVNSVANPDIDVKGLNKDTAQDVYKKRYWDANNISDLPENMQVLAFDTAVNHGTEFKDKALKAIRNGASADEILTMRRNEYERLARENPAKYAQNLPGWKNRLDKIHEYMQGDSSVDMIDVAQAKEKAATMDPSASKDFLGMVERHNAQIVSDIKTEKRDVTDEAMTLLQKGGGLASFPPALMARADKAGIKDEITSYSGATDPDMANYLYGVDAATLSTLDLGDPSIRLKLSAADYERWKGKQQALSTSENIVTDERRKKLVNEAFQKRDIKIKTDKGKVKAQRLNEMLDLDIDAFTKVNNGRYPNEPELTKMVDNLFIKGDYDTAPWRPWGGHDNIFDISVDDIPNGDRKEIEGALKQTGTAVTDAAIIKMWLRNNNGGK